MAVLPYDFGSATTPDRNFFVQLQSDLAAIATATPITPEQFGAVGGGAVDDAPAIQAAIDFCASLGGGFVDFSNTFYGIGTGIVVSSSSVHLRGPGADGLHDGGSGASPAVTLRWIGATDAAAAVVTFRTNASASNSVISGVSMEGIAIDGASIVGYGLRIVSIRAGLFQQIFIKDTTVACYYVTALVTGTETAESADTQRCLFDRCSYRVIDSAAVQSSDGFRLAGSSNANTSFNTFMQCGGQQKNGAGFNCSNADNNIFILSSGFSVGTGYTFDVSGASPNNYFIGCSWGNTVGFIIRTPTAGNDFNQILSMDFTNSASEPTIESGASIIAPLAPWVAYTPTVTALSGTFTTVSATGRYRRVGRTIEYFAQIVITTNGSAASAACATLPISVPISGAPGAGSDSNGAGLSIGLSAGDSRIFFRNTDASYPGANGKTLRASGTYEI